MFRLCRNTFVGLIAWIAVTSQAVTLQAQAVVPTPVGVNAKTTSTTSVNITWNPVAGATSYEVDRMSRGSGFIQIGTPLTNAFADAPLSSGTSYLYRVRAVNGTAKSGNSAADLATTVMLTDDPLTAGVTVQAMHLAQLRTAIGAVYFLATGLPLTTTDSATAGTTIKAVHITELRSALNNALTALGFSVPTYSDASLTHIPVKAIHIQELRDAAGASLSGSPAIQRPTTVVLSLSNTAITPHGSLQGTVTLDVPAVDAVTVDLVVNPANAGTLPSSVMIAADQTSATFTYTDTGATTGNATITASFGSSISQATVGTVTAGAHLVINEVDYDQPGTNDTAEFIEIYNPTAGSVDLTNIAVMLVNGANNSVYDTINLGSAGSLASKHYLVIAGPGVTVSAPATKVDPGWASNRIQNGSPDGIALVDTAAHQLIDAFSYAGSITAAVLTDFAAPVSLVEGTASTALDSNTVSGSLCRSPDGTDTDDASMDWKFCSTITVGSANP